MRRSISLPSFFFPVAAFLVWTVLFVSYLGTVRPDLEFPREILAGEFFVSNLILVLAWFLAGRVWFVAFASIITLLTVYVLLYLDEPGLGIHIGVIVLVYFWLDRLSREIENEKLVHIVSREKVQAKLNLALKGLEEKDHLNLALKKKLERLHTLRGFSDRLKGMTNLKETAQIVINEAGELMPRADQILVFIMDEKAYQLGLVSHLSRADRLDTKEKRGNEYDDWVMRRSQPLLIEDVKNDFRFSLEGQGSPAFRSVLIVPLVSERKVFGVLHLNAEEPGAFHTDDLRFLDIVADMSAVSLRNVLLFEKTRELSIVDSLTECYLFRHAQERLVEEVHRAMRNKTTFGVVMADIDHFNKYDDEFGHTAGDMVLKGIAEILRSSVGPTDIVCRYGGEEFLLILPQKNYEEVHALAEAIRKKSEKRQFDLRRESRRITLSFGLAVFPHDGTTKEELIWKADKNLYEAKRLGRNRTFGAKPR